MQKSKRILQGKIFFVDTSSLVDLDQVDVLSDFVRAAKVRMVSTQLEEIETLCEAGRIMAASANDLRPRVYQPADDITANKIKLARLRVTITGHNIQCRSKTLSTSDVEIIATALATGTTLVSSDKRIILTARKLQVQVLETINVICYLYKDGVITWLSLHGIVSKARESEYCNLDPDQMERDFGLAKG
jgi:predicted nucleic acid-binding protein